MALVLASCGGARAGVSRADVSGRDSVRTTAVARGVVHETHWLAEGPWVVQVVRIDRARCDCRFITRHAYDGLRGREPVSGMAARLAASGARVVAGLNADFFDLRTGDVENTQVVDGAWEKGIGVSESPHHVFPTVHAQVAALADGRVVTGRFRMRAVARVGGDSVVIEALNPQRRGGRGVVLYTAKHGGRTPVGASADSGGAQVDPDDGPATPARLAAAARRDSLRLAADTAARSVVEVALVPVEPGAPVTGGRRRYRVAGAPVSGSGGLEIPPNGVVLSITRDDVASMRDVRWSPGREILLEVALVDGAGRAVGPVHSVVGGWGELLVGGRDLSAAVDSLEGTFPRFSAQRHPRSAVGVADGGRTVLLVGVDGRGSNGSVGMTLVEVGALLRRLGATDGVNLDGGGSTTVWVAGRGVVNRPSDPTGERAVGNGWFVVGR